MYDTTAKTAVKVGQTVTVQPVAGCSKQTVKISEIGYPSDLYFEGTTSQGYICFCGFDNGKCSYFSVGPYDMYTKYAQSYAWNYNGGQSWKVKIFLDSLKVYWTIDGTTPQVGQADLRGTSDYCGIETGPIGYKKTEYPEVKLRGTVTKADGDTYLFPEATSIDLPSIFWLKGYSNGNLIFEDYKTYNL